MGLQKEQTFVGFYFVDKNRWRGGDSVGNCYCYDGDLL